MTVGVKSVTFKVGGDTRAEIVDRLHAFAKTGIPYRFVDRLELDLSNVEGLPEEGESTYSPGDTDEEIRATREKIEQGLRNWFIAKRKAGTWCDGGINDVLNELDIEELPEEVTYTLRREVTAVWQLEVDAYDEADAKDRADWELDSDDEPREGVIMIKTMSDKITAEEQD